MRKVATAADALAQGEVNQTVDVSGTDEIAGVAGSVRQTVEYVQEMAAAAHAVAGGDLTVTVTPRSERDVLGTAIASMVTCLRTLVSEVADGAERVVDSGERLTASTGEASRAAEQVGGAVARATAGVEEQSHTAQDISESVSQLLAAIDQVARGASGSGSLGLRGVHRHRADGERSRASR